MHNRIPPDQNGDSPTRRPNDTTQPENFEQQMLFDFGSHAQETRAAAAKAAAKHESRIRRRVLDYVTACGSVGATRQEIASGIGRPVQSVCSPVLSLLRDGLLCETPDRRTTPWGKLAVVIVATEFAS